MRKSSLQKRIEHLKIAFTGIWSKKRYVLAPAIIIASVGWAYVSTMQNQYETKARVYADTDSILNSLLSGIAVQEDAKEEIKVTSRTLLSRDVREDIAKQADLHLAYDTPEGYEQLIESLKTKIVISGSSSSNVYDISFIHPDPQVAKRVVEITLQKFLDDSTGKTRIDASTAQGFLEDQKEEYHKRLMNFEHNIAVFRQKNQSLLLNNGSGIYNITSKLSDEIEKVTQDINGRQAQINGLKDRFLPGDSKGNEDSVSEIIVETPYDVRLEKLRDDMDQMQLRYTAMHPTIIELKAVIEQLESQQLESQDKILKSASSGALTASSQKNGAALQNFALRISELKAEVDMLKNKRSNLEIKYKEMQENLMLVPQKQAELTDLERELDKTRKTFDKILDKMHRAEISISADKDTQNVKFKIIEAPRASFNPIGPPRILFYTISLLFGIIAGVGLAFVMSQVSPVINGPTHLQTLIGKNNIIGQIEHSDSAKMRNVRRVKALIFFTALSLLFAVYAMLIGHEIAFGESPLKWL